MRGRVAAVLLLLSLVSLDSSGQCGFTARYSGQFRSTIYDVSVDGNYLWTATGYGVQLLEITARGPELLDAVALPGSTRVVATGGSNIAYAGSGARLFVLRRNGNQIEIVRFLDAADVVNDIVAGSALFVATRNGIAHYHLFDPASPARSTAALITSRPNVLDLEIAGSTLYVVRNRENLVAVVELSCDLDGGQVVDEVRGDVDVPTTVALVRGDLWVVNARFGIAEPATQSYWMTRLPTSR